MNEDIAILTADNLKAEADAIRKYIPLIAALEAKGDKEGANIVREIVSDEKNHLNLLQGILMKNDGEIRISSDGMPELFKYLQTHLRND